jgi:hypothetical protein
VGIITKPDLINKGTEGRIALLAKNEDTTKLKLGFFLLKNPSPSQLESEISRSEHNRQELEFFTSRSWKKHGLDQSRVGIDALKLFLQILLNQHIERELPKVVKEIKALLAQTEANLANLGDSRPTVSHIRMFLTQLSMKFHDLTQAALDGNYHYTEDNFFMTSGEDWSSNRLRANIHTLNGQFSTYMRDKGQKRSICNRTDSEVESDVDSEEDAEMVRVTSDEFKAWVKRVRATPKYLRTTNDLRSI